MTAQRHFEGTIATTFEDSEPWWPSRPDSLRTAPNMIVVVLDDTGWSDFGCFGSEISTPAIDDLAQGGVRFNNFHVMPLCSPTRAALMTGRNPHSVGMRFLADADTGFPNARGYVRHDVPMLPEVLRSHGYGTYMVGKWHLTPLHEITPAGPVHNWPLARGFDKYYGFLDGCTDQYSPELFQDNHQFEPEVDENYHLTEDLADRAIGYMRDHLTYRPEVPFYMQFAVGATHAPFQAPRKYIDKYVDVFRKGWDATRADRLARQIELGLAPENTTLTERGETVPAWDSLDADTQELYAHLQAAFAGFLEHTDEQIGRIIHELEDRGILENTIVMVMSDNGASREGARGDVDTNAPYSGVARPTKVQLEQLDGLGGAAGAHYPEGWAMAGNTPFRRFKQFLDLGGIRSPLIVSWPGRAEETGRVQSSFAHAVDIAPTLLDMAGLPPLERADGASLKHAFDGESDVPGRQQQAFETLGHRAIYDQGWFAVTEHTKGASYAEEAWRLYDTTEDFAHVRDVADRFPEKVKELTDLWWSLAEDQQVWPLDDRSLLDLLYHRHPDSLLSRSSIELRPGQGHVPFSSAVCGTNRAMRVRAELQKYTEGTDGVLLASGNSCSGYSLFVHEGVLHFEHNFLEHRIRVTAPEPLPNGERSVGFLLGEAGEDGAQLTLLQGERAVAEAIVPRVSFHLSFFGLDAGRDPVSAVSTLYEAPFSFPVDQLDNVTLTFTEAVDEEELEALRTATD